MTTKVLYIGGAGRSGSTVLAEMLGSLDGFVVVGEVRYLWERGLAQNQLCGCRQSFRQCPFWTAVLTDAFGGLGAADSSDVMARARAVDRIRYVPALANPRLRGPRVASALGEYGYALTLLYRSIMKVSGAAVVVDSSKDPSYAYVLGALSSIELSVAHLIRDSRAVAYSWTRSRVRPEVTSTVEYMKRRKPLRTAVVWAANNVLFDMLGRGHPRFVRLRYEDFAAQPTETLDALAAMVGGPGVGASVPASAYSFAHTVSGNPSRFDARPAPIVIDNEWERSLPARARRIVTIATAPLLVRYGYRLRAG